MKHLIILVLFVFKSTIFASQNNYSTTSEWLMDINSTNKKFKAIQKQFRGFDTAMVEVGYRYKAIEKALLSKNYELALYHTQKIKTAIENGYIRRPAREEASKAYLLNAVYGDFKKALKSKEDNKIKEEFSRIKISCNACHEDQKVGFIVIK